jgi:uncharacterized protein YtpQ (UPF0354 family)
LSAKQRADEVKAHFQAILSLSEQRTTEAPEGWASAQKKVLLQLMPAEYSQKFQDDRALVSRPFIPGVAKGVVIDAEKGYKYVRKLDLIQWKIAADAVFERALKNLDSKSRSAKLQSSSGPEKFLAFEERDGYDAARILLPWVRDEAAKHLGNPFLASLANRDFLILWSTQNSAKFQQFARQKAKDDFRAQPYSLTPATLRVWRDGRIEVAQ